MQPISLFKLIFENVFQLKYYWVFPCMSSNFWKSQSTSPWFVFNRSWMASSMPRISFYIPFEFCTVKSTLPTDHLRIYLLSSSLRIPKMPVKHPDLWWTHTDYKQTNRSQVREWLPLVAIQSRFYQLVSVLSGQNNHGVVKSGSFG